MKKITSIMLILVMCLSIVGCSNSDNSNKDIAPQASQMKSICELATMQCYYHNVAKYMDDDASGALWWKKDRKFWVEYSGVVSVGIDTSLVNIEVYGENVTITIPPATVLDCKVDETTLTKDSFIVAKDSAKVEAEHQTEAFKDAQAKMQEDAYLQMPNSELRNCWKIMLQISETVLEKTIKLNGFIWKVRKNFKI